MTECHQLQASDCAREQPRLTPPHLAGDSLPSGSLHWGCLHGSVSVSATHCVSQEKQHYVRL